MASTPIEFLFNHIFLPSKVPQASDADYDLGHRGLLDLLEDCTRNFRDLVPTENYNHWATICRSVRNFRRLHATTGSISKALLETTLRDLTPGDNLLLYLATQNSGILLRRTAEEYVVESFEAAAPAAEVLAAKNALQWDFPSRCVAVPHATFEDPMFRASFTEFVARASVENVKDFAAISLKAGSMAYESRDTTKPALVGQLLMAILEANGSRRSPVLSRKNIHDDVYWMDGVQNPWRRSPTWLVHRIGLQRSLCAMLGLENGTTQYKLFICFTMATLLERYLKAPQSTPDNIAHARSKLARRCNKLEHTLRSINAEDHASTFGIFAKMKRDLHCVLTRANERLDHTWREMRQRSVKVIRPLPRKADQSSTTLPLIQSGGILDHVLHSALYSSRVQPTVFDPRIRYHGKPLAVVSRVKPGDWNVMDYIRLADHESQLSDFLNDSLCPAEDLDEDDCKVIMGKIVSYHQVALNAYQADPEQSSLMLLLIMELWLKLDALTIRLYPILLDYDPGFPKELMHPLRVVSLEDMKRVSAIESYLHYRRTTSRFNAQSVFGSLSQESLSVRFFDWSSELQDKRDAILAEDLVTRDAKEVEWKQLSLEYDNTMKKWAESSCLYTQDRDDPSLLFHNRRSCSKCTHEKIARDMRICIHEAFLPDHELQSKSIVFELGLPPGIRYWRDTTWHVHQMGYNHSLRDQAPRSTLLDHPILGRYVASRDNQIMLSTTSKPFLNTHYARVSFPVSLDQVCLPHGCKYNLYDHLRGLWTDRIVRRAEFKPNFSSVCAPSLPTKSAYGLLRRYINPQFDGKTATYNDIVASQTKCPNGLTVAEFTAYQNLRLGYRIQWLQLLHELAAPNLTFGTLEVVTLVTQLAHMAGPSDSGELLRSIHWVFGDAEFCNTLLTEIQGRLKAVEVNWREGQTVLCMLILLQRTWFLAASHEMHARAESIILEVRRMTYGWTKALREEICSASNLETAQKRCSDALFTALICRRTFLIEFSSPNASLESEALSCFIVCSITMRDCLPSKEEGFISKLPRFLKQHYINDIKIMSRLESRIMSAILASSEAMNMAINIVWPDISDNSRKFKSWTTSSSRTGWFTSESYAEGKAKQSIAYDLYEGTLMIDGQVLGRLPTDFTKVDYFNHLFGERALLAYPSHLAGMTHMHASLFQGHEVHWGFRDGVPITRICSKFKTFEYVPASSFIAPNGAPDLPMPLIRGRVHWLDLRNFVLEIRPEASMWQSKHSDWRLDLRTRRASRRTSLLVDPQSVIFSRIASILNPFERREFIIVYQPSTTNVRVQLPSLELEFRVNPLGLLESHQLQAMVDDNQDPGTLYGLES